MSISRTAVQEVHARRRADNIAAHFRLKFRPAWRREPDYLPTGISRGMSRYADSTPTPYMLLVCRIFAAALAAELGCGSVFIDDGWQLAILIAIRGSVAAVSRDVLTGLVAGVREAASGPRSETWWDQACSDPPCGWRTRNSLKFWPPGQRLHRVISRVLELALSAARRVTFFSAPLRVRQ